MPKSKLENFIFTLVMAFVMVYAMVCYNIAIDKGAMTNEIFKLAFMEIPIMWPVAVVLEFFVVEKLATKLAFILVNPREDKPIFVILAISSMIVCLMCPVMSLIATLLFANPGSPEIISIWLQKFAMNFPMALCWQIFFCGPAVRNLFGLLGKLGSKNEAPNGSNI